MKTRNKSTKPEGYFRHAQEIAVAADFHPQPMSPETEINAESANESANWPDGNYEYEQMIVQNASFNSKQIAEDLADFVSKQSEETTQIVNDSEGESANWPDGNYEYEQKFSQDAGFNIKQMIEEAAYYKAEQRNFAPGNELSDWLQAEAEIQGFLRKAQ